MPAEVTATPYGRPALAALRAAVAAGKAGDPLAPVTVVVPTNHVGVTARRRLAGGAFGAVTGRGAGVAAVSFLTAYRLAELLGAPALAAAGRRPASPPVVAAAFRRVLAADPGMFRPVADHPATETALVGTYAELAEVTPGALDALARAGRRAREVVRLCRQARDRLAAAWYDPTDLCAAAAAALDAPGGDRLAAELGHVVVYLPQDLRPAPAALLAAVARHCPTTVVVGRTDHTDADAGVDHTLARLGIAPPARPPEPAQPTLPFDAPSPAPTAAALPAAPVAPGGTRILTASDADDEVRAAVRAVIDATRSGTPLDRIAVLYGTDRPYGRLLHEHLGAAGVPRNGAAVRPLAASVAGRALLDLLALADHDFRRADVVGLLARAGEGVPAAAWERISRRAGVVSGRSDWDHLLGRLARELDERAAASEAKGRDPDPEVPTGPRAGTGASVSEAGAIRRQAERTRELRRRALALIDGIGEARARPAPWAARVRWLRALVTRTGDAVTPSAAWPADEIRAAEKIDAALDRLAGLDAVDDPAPLDVFRRTLELELDADLGRVGRFGEGVLVGPLDYAVGLDLDLVVVLGLAEGSLPAPVRDDALLPDTDRAATGGELPLRRDRVGREHRRLLAALAAADRHLLCVPRGDLRATSERVPSRWAVDAAERLGADRAGPDVLGLRGAPWLEVVPSFAHGVTHVPFPATEQEYRLRAGPAAPPDPLVARGGDVIRARRSPAFTRFDGNLAGADVPSPVDDVVSSTRLESWAVCPFAYFGRRLLRVEPVEDPEDTLQMSPLDRGALLHAVLEQFIADVLARPPEHRPGPGDDWSADDRALLRRITEQVCDDYHARGVTGRPVFWRRDRAQLLAQVDRFLDDDRDKRRAAGTRPIAAEYAFGLDDGIPPVGIALPDGRTLRFRGSADRIDEGPGGGLLVLDYKTGRPDEYRALGPDNPDERGTKLQLAVYAQAARAAAGRPDAPVTAQYWFVSDRGDFARLGYEVDGPVLGRVAGTLGTIVAGIEQGVFPSHPDDQFKPWVVCPYCDPDGMGVAELRRQWERKRSDPAMAPYADLVEPLPDDEPQPGPGGEPAPVAPAAVR